MYNNRIELDCGIVAQYWLRSEGTESLRISLIDLYSGYGEQNSMSLMADLFKELHDKGFSGQGISMDKGYYDDIENLYLEVNRQIK